MTPASHGLAPLRAIALWWRANTVNRAMSNATATAGGMRHAPRLAKDGCRRRNTNEAAATANEEGPPIQTKGRGYTANIIRTASVVATARSDYRELVLCRRSASAARCFGTQSPGRERNSGDYRRSTSPPIRAASRRRCPDRYDRRGDASGEQNRSRDSRADPRRYSRAALFGVVAAREAWSDAGLVVWRTQRRRDHRHWRRRHRCRRAPVPGFLRLQGWTT